MSANTPTYSKKRDELVLGVSEADFRLVDAFYNELALEVSNDLSPPTREEPAANAELAESFARLKSMTPCGLRAESARRMRERRRREGR